MVLQIETKAGAGFKTGGKDFRLTDYTSESLVRETDVLGTLTPQPRVPSEECAAMVPQIFKKPSSK